MQAASTRLQCACGQLFPSNCRLNPTANEVKSWYSIMNIYQCLQLGTVTPMISAFHIYWFMDHLRIGGQRQCGLHSTGKAEKRRSDVLRTTAHAISLTNIRSAYYPENRALPCGTILLTSMVE